jgi:hypothetical protein
MKATPILYLLLFISIVYWIVTSTHLLDNEGFQADSLQPVIPKILEPKILETKAVPNPSIPGELPFGPYAQTPSVGSYQYQDPSLLPAELIQMKKLYEDIRSFLVFEGPQLANTSDPTVQLPYTQLRADSNRIQQELAVIKNNPGIQAQLTQQDLGDIEGSLVFLQKKVRLFETTGIVMGDSEGFQDMNKGPKASKKDLELLQTKIYAAILTLSASGTKDPVVQARIKQLQKLYTDVTDMITKLNKGIWTANDIPVYAADIQQLLPGLANPKARLNSLVTTGSSQTLSPIEKQIGNLVGADNAKSVFNNLKEKGMFRVSVDLGYNVSSPTINRSFQLKPDGSMEDVPGAQGTSNDSMKMDLPFDSKTQGMDDRAESASTPASQAGRFDWKKRASSICEQVRLREMNPKDFGCIAPNSLMSPAYSWRGHTKMVCGRLASTMDPSLPASCGCPPPNWKGWTLSV